MALSSSESALLTQTCENMNVAANTCREVLEMLRSLGNTGVVDIATHNNAQKPHQDAKNLVFMSDDGTVDVLPDKQVAVSGWSTYPDFRFYPTNSSHLAYCSRWVESPAGSTLQVHDRTLVALSDGDGNLLARSSIASSNSDKGIFGVVKLSGRYDDADGSRFASVEFCTGSQSDASKTHKGTSVRIYGNQDSNATHTAFYSLESTGIIPYGTKSIGTQSIPFDTAYFSTAATTTSDRREKSGISAIGSEAVDFLKTLRPVQFTVKNGREEVLESDEQGNATNVEIVPGIRHHWGLIAQEVQEALVSAGYDPSDCAVWSLADKNDPDSKQALRYEELIAPMIKVIQQQQERIEALERKVA